MSVRDRDDLVVARLHELAPHLDGAPDPAWQAATRARLVAMAAVRSPAPEPTSRLKRLCARAEGTAPSRWRSRLTAGLAGAAMAMTALATLVAVATDAGPGDPLYGLKRGTEQTQLALAGDARGQTLLTLARTRLHELEELTGSGASALPAAGAAAPGRTVVLAADVDPALVLETLATMDAHTREGAAWLTDQAVDTGDDTPLDVLAAWSEDQSESLVGLRSALPGSTADELDASLSLLSDIGTRATGLEDALGCADGVPVEGSDVLGPVPGLCLPEGEETPPLAGDEGDRGPVPAPAEGPESEGTATVSTPAPGGGTSAGGPDGSGSGSEDGGSLPVPEASGGEQPSVETPGLPLPSSGLPLPTQLPGGTPSSGTTSGRTPSGGTTSSGSSTSPGPAADLPVDIELCLGPIVLGNCTD